jgi:WS/DGAT/MGAT family acyltransferase
MPRLSPVDQAFFLLETRDRPMSIGLLVVLEPPPGTRGRFADRLVRTMLKCPPGPPFSYRVKPGPLPGLLSLVEDEHMDPARQVFRHKLPRGADLKSLFASVCKIHPKRLRHDAPLWEAHFFTGFPGGRVALYFKTHHGLIDGIGFINALNTMVFESPRSNPPRAMWEGLRHYTPPAGKASPRHGTTVLQTANDTRRTATDMLRLIWHQALRDLGLGRGLATPFVSTPNVLKAAPGPHRVLAHCQLPLARVRDLARRGDAKINDVMLTLIDMAMHRYLGERGIKLDRPLVTDIPVALADHGGTGNRITILQAPMGRPGVSPAQRLDDIVQETGQVKKEMRELDGGALTLYSILSHSIASTIESLGLSELPMLANSVISNPAGFQKRLYFNGAEVELALPISVVAHHQVLNITITTYVDELHVTFIALKEAIPDLQRLAEFTAAAAADLDADLSRIERRAARARVRQVRAPRPRTKAPNLPARRAAVR